MLERHEKAITWFQKLACGNDWTLREIGRSLMALGRYDEALLCLTKYDTRFPRKATDLIEECQRALNR